MVSPFSRSTSLHPSVSQKAVPSQGCGFSLLPFWGYCVMPFNGLSFHFWVKMVEPAFITSHDVGQEVYHPWQSVIGVTVMIHPRISFCVFL